MERIRSFIAIELPEEIRAELTSLEQRLQAGQHTFVKWVHPDGVHLTLKFLGSIGADLVPEIVEVMNRVARPASPMSLQIGGLGAFPSWNRPQVVWVGMGGEVDRLAKLQNNLESALTRLGFARESRAFKAHLTLGRVRDQASSRDRQRLAEWSRSVGFESGLSFEARALSLMRSQLTPGGAIYTRLASAGLGTSGV